MTRVDLIERRVSRGHRRDESANLLDELVRTVSLQNLPAALVYQEFASVRLADRAAAAVAR